MRKVMGVVLLALAGAGTAALITASTAHAWDYNTLPANCHTEGAPFDAAVNEYVAYFRCDGVAAHFNYGTQAPPAAATDPSFQGNLDAFVNAHYTAPETTASAPATTTTTDAGATTTAPPATTTPPAVTQTVVQTVTQSAPVDTTATTAAPPTPTEQSLQDQIDALAAKIATLTDTVSRLQKAGDASWLAFQQAVAGGMDVAAAADQARGTWLNAVNQLGEFASVG